MNNILVLIGFAFAGAAAAGAIIAVVMCDREDDE
jgi:hypothetical protein